MLHCIVYTKYLTYEFKHKHDVNVDVNVNVNGSVLFEHMQHFWGESNTFLWTMPTIGECPSDGFSAALSPTCHILLPSIAKIFLFM